jgi:hypothetical protein
MCFIATFHLFICDVITRRTLHLNPLMFNSMIQSMGRRLLVMIGEVCGSLAPGTGPASTSRAEFLSMGWEDLNQNVCHVLVLSS